MELEGCAALVTGASSGIGRAVAIEMAKAGADVAINYRSQTSAAEQIAEEIRQLGRKTLLLQADVSDQSAVEEMVARTAEEFGQLDRFVSNAVYSDREKLVDAEMDGFRRTLEVSMFGAAFGVRAAAQQMIRQGDGGAIVVVSSPHAVIPVPGSIAYNMAKAALDAMARTAAIELASEGIRVNICHPGWTDTPGERKFFTEEQITQGGQELPLGRLGTPEEVARSIVYMLSDEASYMTGSTLLIDGGVSLPWWSNREGGKM